MKSNLISIGSCLIALYLCIPSVIGQDRRHPELLQTIKTPVQDVQSIRNLQNRSRFPVYRQMQMMDEQAQQPVQQQVDPITSESVVSRWTPDANWKELGPKSTISYMDNSDFKFWEMDRNNISGITLAPYDPNVMWTTTVGSGIWKTWNGGQTWIPISREKLIGPEIMAMAVDPFNPNMIYASSLYQWGEAVGLFKTTDGGGNWTQLRPMTYTDHISSILIHPKQNNKILTASISDVYYSENSGATWTKAYGDYFIYPDIADFNSDNIKLVNSPQQPDIVYLSIQDNNGFKVIKSIDFGKTWFDTGFKNLPANTWSMDIAVAPTDANTIYAVYVLETNTGLEFVFKRSTDGGLTWQTQSSGYKNLFGYEIKITVDVDDKNKVYFGTDGVFGVIPDGIYVSRDAGRTFGIIGSMINAVSAGSKTGYFPSGMQQHPITKELICSFGAGGIYKVKTDALSSGDISTFSCPLVPLRTFNMFSWKDNCAIFSNNWIRISDPISAADLSSVMVKDNIVVVGSPSGALKWDGNKWTKMTSLSYIFNGAFTDNTNSLIFNEYPSLSKTTDGGLTLKRILPLEAEAEFDWSYHAPLYVSPLNPKHIYSLRTNLWKTTNGGDSWSKISVPIDNSIFQFSTALGISPANENIIYLGKNGGGKSYVFKSIDGGNSWQDIKKNLPNLNIDWIMVNPSNSNQAWILFQRTRLFITNDGGQTWTDFGAGLPPFPVRSRAIVYEAKRNTVYVGNETGVFIRTPTDNQFRPYNVGMPNIKILDLAIDANNDKIYAATTAGLWVGDLYDASPNVNAQSQKKQNDLNSTIKASPNPSGNTMTVGINVPISTEWSVRLRNSLGQAYYLKNGKDAQRFDINVQSFNTGLYFLEYTSGADKKVEKVMIQH